MRRPAATTFLLVAMAAAAFAQTEPVPQPVPGGDAPAPLMTAEVLARGQQRYDIFCAPCHGFAGHGDGMVVIRGFPAPSSFHGLDLTLERVFDVISSGAGRMLPMAERIPPSDRWAIAAYVKALQLSQRPPGDGQ